MPTPTTTTIKPTKSSSAAKTGWEKSCDCGFNLRNYNKSEFVGMVNSHLKTSHNLPPYSEADVIKGSKTITL